MEFSSQGQGEARPRELGEEIQRKKEQYQNNLQPFYRICKKNEVNIYIYIIIYLYLTENHVMYAYVKGFFSAGEHGS